MKNEFNNQFQMLSKVVISSNWTKDLISAGTDFLEVLTNIVKQDDIVSGTISQKMSFVVEVAGTVVSKEVGYAQVLRQPMFEYCLITYYTNIILFENGEEFSLDKVDKFIKNNKENVLDVIRENVSDDERAELDDACNKAIEYRKLHYNDLKLSLIHI